MNIWPPLPDGDPNAPHMLGYDPPTEPVTPPPIRDLSFLDEPEPAPVAPPPPPREPYSCAQRWAELGDVSYGTARAKRFSLTHTGRATRNVTVNMSPELREALDS